MIVPEGAEHGRRHGRRSDGGNEIECQDAAPGPDNLALAVHGAAAPIRREQALRVGGERDLAA